MAALSELQEMHENPLKVNRRLIYLHRLVGDDVLTPRAKTIRPNPWRVTIVFFIYTLAATLAILSYIDVPLVSGMNDAIKSFLQSYPYKIRNGKELHASDIREVEEVPTYILDGLLVPMVWSTNQFPGAAGMGNRVMNQIGFCKNTSVVLITIRRMKLTTDSASTTSTRFSTLYPKAWQGDGIAAGSPISDNDNQTDFWGNYTYHDTTSPKNIPESKLGYVGRESKTPMTYAMLRDLKRTTDVWVNWKFSPACNGDKCDYKGGYKNAGGYVAAVVIQKDSAHSHILSQMMQGRNEIDWVIVRSIAQDMRVLLLDPQSPPVIDATVGTCGTGVRANVILPVTDFLDLVPSAFSRETVSVAVEFVTYNPNLQMMSSAHVIWDVTQAGIIGTPLEMDVHSIKLDLNEGYQISYEIVYILGCAFYFVELFVYKFYKQRHKLFRDVWTYINMLSIISSILSVTFRIQYSASNKSFLSETENINVEIDDLQNYIKSDINLAYLYQVFSAIALITIWQRLVELLAKTLLRVKLLEMTLVKAGASVFAYFCYILVILAGFWAFASVHFAPHSLEFGHPGRAFISCFQMLCLNINPYFSTQRAYMRSWFFFPYMLFSIVSVQMFNSIINYAYNSVSDEMEPLFRKQLMDQRNKQNASGGMWRVLYSRSKLVCLWLLQKCGFGKKKQDPDEDKEPSSKDKPPKVAHKMEELTQSDKDMVQEFKQEARKQANEKCGQMCLYAVFATSYILFLGLALKISTNGETASSVAQQVLDYKFEAVHATEKAYFRKFEQISDYYDLTMWITRGLPEILFPVEKRVSPSDDIFYGNDTFCLQNWNCLVTLKEDPTHAEFKIARITARRYKQVQNRGAMTIKGKVPKDRFWIGEAIIPDRVPKDLLGAGANANSDLEDTTSQLTLHLEGRTFCQRGHEGDGWRRKGGIVCLMDADRTNMTKQLEIMMKYAFYNKAVASVVVEFVTYNGNANNLVIVHAVFQVHPSGRVTAQAKIQPLSLLGTKSPRVGAGVHEKVFYVFKNSFQIEMIFGLIYIILVIYFVGAMSIELYQEMQRKYFNEQTPFTVTFWEYFALDVFHSLDLFSYLVSTISFVLFIAWLVKQMDVEDKTEGKFSEFLSYAEELDATRHLYKLLSSCNLLSICIRPLKFFRSDPRMAKLNTTFSNALVDIVWFNIMLIFFFAGFVLFAHIIFGLYLPQLATLQGSMVYLFKFLIGSFNFWELYEINSFFAVVFVFCFLFLFKFFFLNIFFAILDKNFVTGEAPPMNPWRALKPVLGRLIRWIDWDQDLTMEGETSKNKEEGPPSRAGRVHRYAMQIQEVKNASNAKEDSGTVKKSKALNDVCDADERMNEVLRWSREEAKHFVEAYRKLNAHKIHFNNDEVFLKQRVKDKYIEEELNRAKEAMNEAERLHRYAILVNERLAMRDQDVLAKYIMRLEVKIEEKMKEYHCLNFDVHHLTAESASMAYNAKEIERLNDESGNDAAALDEKLAVAESGHSPDHASGERDDEAGSEKDEEDQAPAPASAAQTTAAKADADGTVPRVHKHRGLIDGLKSHIGSLGQNTE